MTQYRMLGDTQEENATNENGVLDENGLRHFPDGSVLLEGAGPTTAPPISVSFDQNLADVLPEHVLSRIGYTLKKKIEEDIDSHKNQMASVAEIIKLLGLQTVKSLENQDLNIDIYSSALFETLLDIVSTVLNSIFPSKTPVSCVILGESTPELEDSAKRKALFFNTFLRTIDKGFDKELRRSVLWSILTGSIYCKVYVDSLLQRPTMRMIKPEDFIINSECSSHLSALRKTQIHRMDKREFQLRQYTKEYSQETNISPVSNDNNNPIRDQLDDIRGVKESQSNDEEKLSYIIYETHTDFMIEEDKESKGLDIPLPYIVTLDSKTGKILRLIRNWQKEDPLKRKREFFVNFSFLPSLTREGTGLIHYAGSMAQAVTTICRQLIKSGQYASFPAGFYAHGVRMEENSLSPEPGTFSAIQTGGVPLDQALSFLPYKEPSQQLFVLKQGLEEAIKQPAAIIKQQIMEMMTQAPMGSILAAIEASQKVINYVIQGYHESFTEMLQLFSDRFLDWLPNNQPYPYIVPGGGNVLIKSDFTSNLQVIPSTDPKLQNATYRLIRAQMLLQTASGAPELHNMTNVYANFYENMDLSPKEIAQIMKPDPKEEPLPPAMDPISENANVIKNQPINANIEQDHQAHINIHQSLLGNEQIMQSNPAIGQALAAHIAQHMSFAYTLEMCNQYGIQIPEDPSQLPIEQQNEIAQVVAQNIQQQQEEQPQQPAPELIIAQAEMISAEAEKEMVQVRAMEAESNARIKTAQIELQEKKLELEKLKLTHELSLKKTKSEDEFAISSKKIQLEGIKSGVPDILEISQNYASNLEEETGQQQEGVLEEENYKEG